MDTVLMTPSSQGGGKVFPSASGEAGVSQGFSVGGSFRDTLTDNRSFAGFSGAPEAPSDPHSASKSLLTESSDLQQLLTSLQKVLGEEETRPGNQMTPSSPNEAHPLNKEDFGLHPLSEEDLGLSGDIEDNFSPEELVSLLNKLSLKEMRSVEGVSEMDLKDIEKMALDGSISISQLEYVQKALSKEGVSSSVMDLQKVLTRLGYVQAVDQSQTVYMRPQAHGADSSSPQAIEKALLSESLPATKDTKASLMRFSETISLTKGLSSSATIGPNLSEGSVLKIDPGSMTQKSTSASEWFPITVNRQSGEWGKELVSALGDRLRMQVSQGVKEASVRLDPPELGRVDFTVRLDGDRVNVQINSNNHQVRELLAQQIDRLRMDLAQDSHGASVDVNVGDGKNRQGDQQKENVIANNSENVVASSDNELKLKTVDLTNNNKSGLNTTA